MKVKELIEKLKEFDKDSIVVISGYEGGVNEVNYLTSERIRLNQNTQWYYGKHEISTEDSKDRENTVKGVYLS